MVRVRAVVGSFVIAIVMGAGMVSAEQQPQTPAPAQPTQPTAPAQPGAPPGTTAPTQTRTFSAPAGLLFNTVRPERVADFEKVLAYLQAALENSSDPGVRDQAKGWRIFKATETGPGNVVLYLYLIDPAVMGADYGIGKILADAYPDQAEQIWKLYTSSVSGGGTLLNLTPVKPVPPPPLGPASQKPSEKPSEKP